LSLHVLSRPALRSTLVPYTTLFRSPLPLHCVHKEHFVCAHVSAIFHHRPDYALHFLPAHHRNRVFPCRHTIANAHAFFIEPDRKDRKSTRLNSSHVSISYAVFCLKK